MPGIPTQFQHLGMGALPVEEPSGAVPLAARVRTPAIPTEGEFDLTPFRNPIRDSQGWRGSCVGWGTMDSMGGLHRMLFPRYTPLSPLWAYNLGWDRFGRPATDGITIPSALDGIKAMGAVRERDYPYDEMLVGQVVPETVRQTTEYRLDSYDQGWGLNDAKVAMALTGPIPAAIAVRGAFYSPTPEGVVDDQPEDTTIYGYHCVSFWGWSDAREWVPTGNSWGEGWGDRGNGYLTYAYLEKNLFDVYALYPNRTMKIVGDLTGDSVINVLDAQMLLAAAAGKGVLTPFLANLADANRDGRVTVADAVLILRNAIQG